MYGAGGFAKPVIGILERQDRWDLVGLLDDNSTTDSVLGYPVIGGSERAEELLASGISRVHVAVEDNASRLKIAAELAAEGFTLVSVVDPTTVLLADATVGSGALLHVYAVLTACRVGDLAIINAHAQIGHDCVVGDGVHLAPHVGMGGNARIGDRAMLGTGAVVLPGIKIGNDVVVGANAVVNRDVEDNLIVAGVPAKPIGRNT